MLYLIIIGCLFAFDQTIKRRIEAQPGERFPQPLEGTRGLVTLHKNHNKGLMMGALQGRHNLSKWIPFGTIVAVGTYFIYALAHKEPAITRFSLALILGGALSNLVDRFRCQYVIDYFTINVKKLNRVVFNLGDIFIFAGTFLVLVYELIRDFKDR